MSPGRWIDSNCDGAGPHMGTETRVYPLGSGGNLILCKWCWHRENLYRKGRGDADKWPIENWDTANVYNTEAA